MRVWIVDAPSLEPVSAAARPEQVVGIGVAQAMPSLAEHGAAEARGDALGCGEQVCGGLDVKAREDLGLGDIGGDNVRERDEPLLKDGNGGIIDEPRPARRDHHGVEDHVSRLVMAQAIGDGKDEGRRAHHANLYRVGPDVRKHRVYLRRQKLGRDIHDGRHAHRVLGSQRRDGAHGKDPVQGHRLDVRLDAGSPTGVAPGDGQRCFHLVPPLRGFSPIAETMAAPS